MAGVCSPESNVADPGPSLVVFHVAASGAVMLYFFLVPQIGQNSWIRNASRPDCNRRLSLFPFQGYDLVAQTFTLFFKQADFLLQRPNLRFLL